MRGRSQEMAAVDTQLPAEQHGYMRPRIPIKLPILDCDINVNLPQSSYTSTSSGISLPKAVYGVLNEVASNLWPDVDTDDELVVDCLQGAMTNKVYSCMWMRRDCKGNSRNALPDRKVILRLYGEGTAVFFQREMEALAFERMSAKGHGPRLLAKFPAGRVEEFLHAETLSAHHLREDDVAVRLAKKLKEFHHLSFPGNRDAQLWDRIRKWHSSALQSCTPEAAASFHLPQIGGEIAGLQAAMTANERVPGGTSPVVYCHNDLQYGNIMRNRRDGNLTLIDYEYSCYNPLAYDIANLFCEMTADYHTETPHVMQWETYPDIDERRRFVRAYIGDIQDDKVERLVQEAELYVVASHLLWGMWGIISAAKASIDFDYSGYASQRLTQYQLTKGRILGGKPSIICSSQFVTLMGTQKDLE